jgi:hypothetical protein
MTHNITNIKVLIKVIKNKRYTTFKLAEVAIKRYHYKINTLDLNNPKSAEDLLPSRMFYTLVKKFLPSS